MTLSAGRAVWIPCEVKRGRSRTSAWCASSVSRSAGSASCPVVLEPVERATPLAGAV